MSSKLDLLTPDNSALALIDYQPQMFFRVQSHDRHVLVNAVLGLAKATKSFKVPAVLSAVETKGFSGNEMPQLLDVFPEHDHEGARRRPRPRHRVRLHDGARRASKPWIRGKRMRRTIP